MCSTLQGRGITKFENPRLTWSNPCVTWSISRYNMNSETYCITVRSIATGSHFRCVQMPLTSCLQYEWEPQVLPSVCNIITMTIWVATARLISILVFCLTVRGGITKRHTDATRICRYAKHSHIRDWTSIVGHTLIFGLEPQLRSLWLKSATNQNRPQRLTCKMEPRA
jgi:hypothetical protein